jgi:hypothetical protein
VRVRRLDRFIFAAEDARRLGAVRFGLCGLLAFRLAYGNYSSVAGQPRALFQPASYMRLFSQMPGHGLTVALQAIGATAAVLAAVGLLTRFSLPTAFVCSLVLNGMLNSTGKVIHNDVLLTLCLLPLLVAVQDVADAWSADALLRRRRARSSGAGHGTAYGWPICTAMAVVALAYFFVGFQKLRHSGVEWFTSDNLRWILYASSDQQAEPNRLALFVANRAWLAHLLAAGTMALELSFPLCLVVPRLRWFFIPAVISMHVGILLAMRLDYSAWWICVLIVFVNWPVLVERLQQARLAVLPSPLRGAPG